MIKNPFAGKSSRTKIFAAITAAAVILLLVLNLLLFSLGIYNTAFLDLTPEGLFTLRDVMVDACDSIFYNEDGSLREPGIKMTFCADPDTLIANSVTRPLYHMAIAMSNIYPNFEVVTENIIYNPTAIAEYKTTSLTKIEPADVILSYGSRYRVASADSFWRIANDSYYSFDGEYKLATIMLSLTLINRPVAYFVTGHGEDIYMAEDDANYIAGTDYSVSNSKTGELVDLLTERGLTVRTINLMGAEAVPDDCALLIINNPKSDFAYDPDKASSFAYVSECEKIDNFLTAGRGSVMVAKDYKINLPVLEEFLAEWGMGYTNTLIKDPAQSIVDGKEPGVTVVADYNDDENSYAYEVYGEYATLESAPRVSISETGYIECTFEESSSMGEPGSLDTSRIFAPFLFTSEKARAYAPDPDGNYVYLAAGESQKTVAALCGRQTIDNSTAEFTYSYLFCAASAGFLSSDTLGNASFANYDVVSALVQNIARLDTYASMELGGISGNNYTGFGGKVLVDTDLNATDKEVYEHDESGKMHMVKVNYGLGTAEKIIYTVIIALIPLSIAAVGIIIKIKRKYL